ncbi:MAG TPA: (d)CMP kinase [Candidatus Saccharimonadales bacterium]|nr:(d)CMP kinase [Candidatus Saccharimonadales bacterium]
MPAERLQKLLARAGIASRRASEGLIAAGRVTVNGRVAELGEGADATLDRIEVDGMPLPAAEAALHFAIHKPAGVLSSAHDERGRRSVVNLVTEPGLGRLWPAGRLDVDSEGLMVLTNDGAWANRVLHPRYGIEREYAALSDQPPSAAQIEAMLEGVELDDGPARLLVAERAAPPAEVVRLASERGDWLRVRVSEGRKREVRRIFAAVGLQAERLVRTRLGPLTIDGLPEGAWRRLRPEEVDGLAGSRPRVSRPRTGHDPISVAIDGTSGSGKSTIGHALAQRMGATFVDTGLMYRALTLAALERGIDPDDAEGLGRLAGQVRIEVRKPRRDQADRRETVLLDRRDVTHQARMPRIDRIVSAVSRHASVRAAMLGVQRAAARRGDTVMVGRDIGTVVLPDATLKVFLTASAAVRAARRAAEMGRPDRGDKYLSEIERRDAADTQRPVAPLRKAAGALVLDTGELDVDASVEAILAHLPARP